MYNKASSSPMITCAFRICICALLIAILPIGVRAQLANSPWPMFRHDLRHTALSSYHDATPTGTVWKYNSGNGLSSTAIAADGTIYLGGTSALYALNANGTLKWTRAIASTTRSTPAIASDGTVYIGSLDNNIYAVNPTGTQKWAYLTGNDVTSSPAIGPDGTVYVGSRDGSLYAMNPNGTKKWSRALADIHMSSPAVASDGTVYVGSKNFSLYAINPNGTIKWSYATGGDVLTSPALSSDEATVYFGSMDGYFYALSSAGALRWRIPVYYIGSSTPSSPAVGSDGTIYAGSASGFLYALNPDGTERWRFGTGSDIRSSSAISADGTIYFGCWNGFVYALNADGSEKWHYRCASGTYASPAIAANGTVVEPCMDGYVYGNLPGALPSVNPPSNLTATALSGSQVRLNWQDNSSDEYCFRIERKLGAGGAYGLVTTVGANVITYDDSGLTSGQTYYYRVCAVQDAGYAVYSNEAMVQTPSPAAPTNLVATPISGTRVDLTWSDNSWDELGFKIERMKGPDGHYRQVAKVGPDAVSYSDLSVNPATNYYYRVCAYTAQYDSAYSNDDWACTPGIDYSQFSMGNTSRRHMALTFDAGTARIRSGMLDILLANKVYCSMFPTGAVTEAQPDLVARIAFDGHHLGNHSYNHPHFPQVTDAEIISQLTTTEGIIYNRTGHYCRPYFRAPYGDVDARVLATCASIGYRSVYWTVDCGDASWLAPVQEIIDRTLNNAGNGVIMLYHITVENTELALPTIITELKARGYELVTIPEILAPEEVSSPPGMMNAGWNLISFPTEIANGTPVVVFRNREIDGNLVRWDSESSSWRFYDAFNPGAFGPISPDEAYYLNVPSATTLKCAGAQPTVPRHIKLPQASGLPAQWALIGYPFSTGQEWSNCSFYNPTAPEPKTRSYLEAVDAGWINPDLWWWDSSSQSFRTAGIPEYFPSTTQAEAWRGYWIQTNVDGTELIIPVP